MRLRYRPFQAVAIATLSAVITACAAFAPLYDRAMRQALSDISIANSTFAVVGLQLTGTSAEPARFGTTNREAPPPPETVAAAVPDDLRGSYLEPVLGYTATVTVFPEGLTDPRGQILWRDGQCDHVAFVDGGCPQAPGEVAVSQADAEGFDLTPGTTFRVSGVPLNTAEATVPTARMTVTGVYEQDPDDYWFGLTLTGRSGTADPAPPTHIQHDVWLTARDTFDGGDLPPFPDRATTADFPLDAGQVGVDDIIALGDALPRLAEAERHGSEGQQVTVYSGLPDIAHDIEDQTEQSRVTVPLLMAQLGLLALVVLWLVLLAVTEQRRPEVALARLRGRGRRGARALLAGELLPVALAGVVPGLLLAVGAAWVARTAVLPGSAPFELGLRLVAAVAIAAVVLVAVTLLAVVRVAREPVATLLRRVPPRRAGWALGVGDALAIAGAGGVVVVFATGGLDGPIALAAPGLLAIVVGLVLAHLTTPTAAIVGRRMLRGGRVRGGVSVLDAARSPATRRIVAIVTLAAALAVFSADALLVGDRNRASAAEQEAGAPVVVDVAGIDLAAVRAALAQADPGGASATPVVRVLPPAEEGTGTLAVVPDAFRRIALFPQGGAPDASAWDRIAVPDVAPIRLTGTGLAIDVDDSTLRSRRSDGVPTPVRFGLDLVTPTGETLHTTLGELDAKTRHVHLETQVSCADGCFVTAVWLGTLPGATMSGSATLRDLVGVTDGQAEPVGIGPATQWTRIDDPRAGTVEPTSTSPDELTVRVASDGPDQVLMPQVWLPTTVPALVSGALPPGSSRNRFLLQGLDGETQPGARVATLSRVPASGPRTALVNLDLVERGSALAPLAQVEVWLADDDPGLLASVEAALADHGVAVTTTRTLDDVRTSYDDSAATWSLQLAALVGVAALLIALLVLVVSAVSSWRFRTRDLAALRMSGVPGRAISSLAVATQLPAVVVGVVAGALAGLAGAQLALPIVPLFAEAPEVSTLDLDTAWGAVVLAALTALGVLGAGSVVIGRAMARRSDVRRLRESGL